MSSSHKPVSRLAAHASALLAVLVGACSGEVPVEPAPPTTCDSAGPGAVCGAGLASTPTGPVIAGELVVGVVAGVDPQAVDDLAAEVGARVAWRGPGTGYYLLRFVDHASAADARSLLAAMPEVAEVEFNHVCHGAGIGTSPKDQQWNLSGMGLDPFVPPVGALGVRVAVLDSGVAYEDRTDSLGSYALAPDLGGVAFLGGYDFVNDDDHPNDDQGHGTHIAGVIAAADGITSVAPGAEIIPVKVLDATNLGTELALAEGIHYAVAHGAQVVNMSLSFPPAFFPSRYLQRAIDEAASQGVVVVAAVGNHGEQVVTYPAAFRDVIAAGASALQPDFTVKKSDDPWRQADKKLELAAYSNAGQLVDVLAPAGAIDRDVNGDGNPEAVLAQTFDAADPTTFDYYFYAGTSQAAAMVSGLAAVMLGQNPELTPFQVRALLGETAKHGGDFTQIGHGFVSGDAALDMAPKPRATKKRPRFYAASYLSLRRTDVGDRYGLAEVEVLDEQGDPAAGVKVYGTFTGGAYASQVAETGEGGVATFSSPTLLPGADRLVAFQVDAVVVGELDDDGGAFDRPRGMVRIDSCSLEALSAFAIASGIGTSPSPPSIGHLLDSPITIAYRPLLSHPDEVPSLQLLNFSWGLATVPMSVTVDEEWFLEKFPGAGEMTVLSAGSGIGTSPIQIDPESSFPHPVLVPATDPASCVDLLVRTFSSDSTAAGYALSPLVPDPRAGCSADESCPALTDALASMWEGVVAGGAVAGWDTASGLDEDVYTHLARMVGSYYDFGAAVGSAPVATYGRVLDAAGMALTPVASDAADGTGVARME